MSTTTTASRPALLAVLETREPIGPNNESGTADINTALWIYRVKLNDTQAIVGFPVCERESVRIAFERETDPSACRPYTCTAEKIYDHITSNGRDREVTREACLVAIQLIQDAARAERDSRLETAFEEWQNQ